MSIHRRRDAPPTLPPAYRVRDVAERLRVDSHRVLAWIRSGRLRAMDVSGGTGARPRWRIRPEDLEALELSLSTSPEPKTGRRRARSGWKYTYF